MIKLLFSFKGRVPRRMYWLIAFPASVGVFVISTLVDADYRNQNLGISFAILPIYALLIWIALAVIVKRWHDRNKSGFWVFINIIPIIGPIWAYIENGFLAGTQGPNKYDEILR